MRKKFFIIIMRGILVWKIPLFYKGKYKKLFSFAPMFEKLSLNK